MTLACRLASVASLNESARTVEVTWSTGGRVERITGSGQRFVEVLSLAPGHIRLERLNAGAPLLDSHSGDSVRHILGVVVAGTARVVGARDARATVRFSGRRDVEPIWQDVRDRILSAVSVGYHVYTFRKEREQAGELPVWTAIDWEPYELSLVPMPADAGATIRDLDGPVQPRAYGYPAAISDADRLRHLRLAQARA